MKANSIEPLRPREKTDPGDVPVVDVGVVWFGALETTYWNKQNSKDIINSIPFKMLFLFLKLNTSSVHATKFML